jgi:retron-type reverse transcriptase
MDKIDQSLFERICSLENLFLAWSLFSLGKHTKSDVMAFEYQLEDNLFILRDQLVSGSYRHDPYRPFTIYDPKRRNIHKATVKDRIIHQALVNVIEPFFEKRFIFDSFSCRVEKGTHAAVKRLRRFLSQTSKNDTRTVYALKCDVRRFFASVDHGILLALIERVIKDEPTLGLIKGIIKSFSMDLQSGLPLGNLTSQLFANVYLNELDRFVKFDLREKYYIRYCDDFVILTPSRSKALNLANKINSFLKTQLCMEMHPKKTTIRTWEQGIDLLGYVLMPNATVLRTKTVKRILKRVTHQNLPSYTGLCKHADAYELERLLRTKAAYLSQADL